MTAKKLYIFCKAFTGNPYDNDAISHVRLLGVKKPLIQEVNVERL